jgi:hypothetical protein
VVLRKVLLSERCKLYYFADEIKEWKEEGVGDFKILRTDIRGGVRFRMRREPELKTCCNHLLTADMVITPLETSDRAWTWTALDITEGKKKSKQYALKFKTAEIAANWMRVVDSCKKELMEMRSKSVPEGTEMEVMTAKNGAKKTGVSKAFGMPAEFDAALKATSWECSECLTKNDNTKINCLDCEAALKATSWECSECLTKNDNTKINCLDCEAAKPGHEEDVKKPKEAAKPAATTSITYGAGGGGSMCESSACAPNTSATAIGLGSTCDSMSTTTAAAAKPARSFDLGMPGVGTISSDSDPFFGTPKRQPATTSYMSGLIFTTSPILGKNISAKKEKKAHETGEKAGSAKFSSNLDGGGLQVEPVKEAGKVVTTAGKVLGDNFTALSFVSLAQTGSEGFKADPSFEGFAGAGNPLFGSGQKGPSKTTVMEDAEEYEPDVYIQPVIPLPELIHVSLLFDPSLITFNVPLFKKLRDIIFFCGTITL